MAKVKPIPDGSHTVTPYLTVRDATRALEFYRNAFGAEELFRLAEPSGRIGHAELRIGSSTIMLSDEYPDFGALSPASLGGSPVRLHLRVKDVDAFVRQAIAAGATQLRPVKDEFHGERTGMLADPFGHQWFVATHIEDVSPAEMQRRFTKALSSGS
jgi:PhnB protein